MTELCPFPFAQGPNVTESAEHAQIRAAGEPMRVRLGDGRTALVVADYEDVRTVLSDPRFSREAATGNPFFARTRQSLALSASDAPDHTRRRKAIAHAFSSGRVTAFLPELRRIADELIDAMLAGGSEADLVASFTIPFTMRPICLLIGIPEQDCALLKPWGDAMMSITRYTPEQVAAAHKQMNDYLVTLVAAKQAAVTAGTPDADLLSDLLRGSDDAEGLSTDEIAVMGAGLLMAGYETTSNHLAASLYVLLQQPSLRDRIGRDEADLPLVIEELLRFISLAGTGGHKHQATADVQLSDTLVRAGELVVPLTEAANHDPAVFDDADTFRPDRTANPHIAFGFGRHFCPGAALARAELDTALRRLTSRLPGLELAVPAEDVTWRQDMNIGGPWALPARWC